ncbi:MAG: hypothetical protein WCC58_02215 [Burkholderiales bacterium]
MNLKIVAVGMLMTGVILTGLLSTGNAEAQRTEPTANMQNFTADEQRAAINGGHGTSTMVVVAEAPQAAKPVVVAAASTPAETSSWNVPAAIWLAASGLAGMGLLQRRKK